MQAAQVRLLVDAYGLASGDRAAIVEAIVARQEQNIRWWKERLDDEGISADNRRYAHEVIEWTGRERGFTAAHEDAFASALGLTPQEARSAAALGCRAANCRGVARAAHSGTRYF